MIIFKENCRLGNVWHVVDENVRCFHRKAAYRLVIYARPSSSPPILFILSRLPSPCTGISLRYSTTFPGIVVTSAARQKDRTPQNRRKHPSTFFLVSAYPSVSSHSPIFVPCKLRNCRQVSLPRVYDIYAFIRLFNLHRGEGIKKKKEKRKRIGQVSRNDGSSSCSKHWISFSQTRLKLGWKLMLQN